MNAPFYKEVLKNKTHYLIMVIMQIHIQIHIQLDFHNFILFWIHQVIQI